MSEKPITGGPLSPIPQRVQELKHYTDRVALLLGITPNAMRTLDDLVEPGLAMLIEAKRRLWFVSFAWEIEEPEE